jgi:hypothetical protein
LSIENKELREQNLKLESKLLDIVLNNNKQKKSKLIYANNDDTGGRDQDDDESAAASPSPQVLASIEVPELVSGKLLLS